MNQLTPCTYSQTLELGPGWSVVQCEDGKFHLHFFVQHPVHDKRRHSRRYTFEEVSGKVAMIERGAFLALGMNERDVRLWTAQHMELRRQVLFHMHDKVSPDQDRPQRTEIPPGWSLLREAGQDPVFEMSVFDDDGVPIRARVSVDDALETPSRLGVTAIEALGDSAVRSPELTLIDDAIENVKEALTATRIHAEMRRQKHHLSIEGRNECASGT